MNKQVLSPFDRDMCAMIEGITRQEIEVTASDTSIRLSWAQNGSEGNDKAEGQRIEALKQAIRGRLGDRLIEFFYDDGMQSVYMKYDPEEYPEETRTRLVGPDATAGTRYCRTLLEVDAIQFRRDNVNDVLRFTGGGTVTTPRTPDGEAMFSFPDGNGIFVDVPESWYIIRELNGRFTARPERDFKREFEPKNNPVENTQKEPTNKGRGDCANSTNEDVNGNGYREAFKSEQSRGTCRCQEYKPKNQRTMINREQFIKEIAEVVNRNSMEKAFNDTPDFILARIAVEAMEMFTRASAHRDDYHGFRTADYDRKYKAIRESEKKAKPVKTCKGCPLIDVCSAVQMEKQPERKREYKKPEAFDELKEAQAMADFFGEMFPGTEVEIHRIEPRRKPRDKRRAKNKRDNRKGKNI